MKKPSEKLAKAIAYEAKKKQERDENKRPAFHVTPTTGWCNDPNGFSRFGDEYHLFYQYYPYENKWGPMHWGHCKTKDFINGKNFRARWHRIWNTTDRDAFPEQP